ncbi:MAG: DUF87 domain-containing protein [Candidatus Aenigmarchaeota archaeon]|nr:DUF87 domain-containing protein [Candidatus Aenigmarchaeota archaeon]
MVQKRHVPLILAAVVLLVLLLSGMRIPEAFAAVQRSFVLNPDSAFFSFEENSWNDSTFSNEYNYLSAGNATYWVRIPKNSTVANATMNLTGKIIYVYSVQATTGEIYGLSIGNATVSDNQISFGTKEGLPTPYGKVKLLYGNNGSYIWNMTFSSGYDVYSTAIGNVTSDTGSEIAAGSGDGKVYLLYSNGTKIWEKSIGAVKSVKIGDVYGNGINYIIAASNKVYVINSSGGENWSTSTGYTIFDIALGNFSSDPGNEIIVGCAEGKIFILNATGSIISNKTVGSLDINSVDVGNVTSDPGNEIAAGSQDYNIYIINSSGNAVWNYSTGGIVKSVKIGDVTTQYPGYEVVAGSNDNKVYTLDNSGNLIWSFEADSYINTIGIGNLTSDTGNEVAAGAGNGYLYVFNFDYFPDNVSIDVNGSGYDWSYSGKLRSTVEAGGTGTFISAIQNYLSSTCIPVSGICDVPVLFHSDGPGKLNISGLNFTYSYNISNLVSAPTVNTTGTWSRTMNINVNESVGNQIRNISFLSNPSNDISVQYIRINATATSCDFNGSSYSVTTAESQVVCDVLDFTIPSSGALPGPFLLWDSNMSTGTPVLMNESAGYYTNTTDNFLWRKNLTIWNTTNTIIYNVTANTTINDTAVRGLEFLNVTWKGSVCDITPSAICPVYTAKTCSGDIFYYCKQDTNSNGVYDFFKWVQPYSNSSVSYVTGGSTNLAANLSGQNVTSSQAIWGSVFNYSVYVNDTEGDSVNVSLWIMRNLSGAWERNSTQSVTGSGQLSFNLTSNISWVGLASYKFEYQDFNAGYAIHSSQNTSVFSGPTVSKHNVSLVHIQGNNSVVNRNSPVLLSVGINDTETGAWTNESVNCVFWVTTNGAAFDAGHYNTTNSSGHCNFLFTPDASYAAGNQTWKAGVWNDTYYADSNSTSFVLTVKGRINITLVSPVFNQSFFRNSTNTLTARMIDEFGSSPTTDVSGYNCTFWFINDSANDLGNATTNPSGWCTITWNPNCSVSLGQFTVNVTLSGSSQFYSIQGSENHTQILMKDVLLTVITSPSAYSSYHKGDSITLNSATNDTCSLCSSGDYNTTWNIKFKQFFQVSLNETRGFSRANETIIINGTELEGEGIDLSDWRIAYTKVIYNGQEIPSEVKAWTNSSRTEINSTQVFLNNYSELVFLASIPALQAASYLVYYNVSNQNDWNLSYILNGGFESGSLSPWSCANSSGCAFDLCDCRVTTGNNETAGNYSLRMLVVPSIDYTNMSVQQSVNTGINSSYIKIRYKFANMSSGTSIVRIAASSGTCTLNLTQEFVWTEALCFNSSFQNVTLVTVTINSTTKDGSYRYLYIDYICIADSAGNCTSMDSGHGPRKVLASQAAIGSGNNTWQVPANETLGARRLLANSSGPNHAQNFSTFQVYLFGMSNISRINLSSGNCTFNQTFQCMSNATIDYFCVALDVNTSQGIHNYNVSFFMNSSYMGSNMTNSSGYAVFRNSTDKGTYNISCNISDTTYEPGTYYNITANNSASMIVDIISGNTTAVVFLSPVTETAASITREQNYTYYLNVTVNNTGNGSMFSPLVNISAAPAGIFVQPMTCPTLTEGSTCSSSLQTSVSQSAVVSSQVINITVSWSNADSTQGNSSNQTSVTVESHTVLNITQAQLNVSMARGNSGTAGNFTVESYGNTPISNVSFSLSGANASEIAGWITYNPSSISSIPKAGTSTTLINLAIQLNATEGVYMATLTANATGSSCSPAGECWDMLSLLINVTPPDWTLSPLNLSKTIGLSGQNGTIGTITVTNSRNQNYSFSVSVTGNGSGYIKTDKSSFNVTALSSAYLYVYHNTTGAYNPGYWFANVTVTNLNGAFPPSMNTSVNLDVINLTIRIVSPNQTNPTLPVNATDRINLTVNATLSGANVTSNMIWAVLVGGQACGDVQSSYNSSAGFWEINCTAPNITGNVIYNPLTVTGNYTAQQGTIVSDQQADAVKYNDITPPQISSITVNPVNYYGSVPYIIINATITDNTAVNSSWLVITQPNGTNVTVGNPSNVSDNYTFNFSNPNSIGDYDVYVFANDSYSYTNSTRGWFDVYRPFTMSGTLANPNSVNQSINFTFYRLGTSTIIHNFSTNSSQASYNWSVHDRVYDLRVSFFGHTTVLYGVNTTASAINQYNTSATNVSSVFRFDNFPNRTSQDISNFDLPNTAQNIILGFVIETPNLSYSTSAITIDYTSALAAALGTITVQESNLRIFRCTNWNFQSRVCTAGEFSHFNESLTPDTTANTFTFSSSPSTAYAVAESCYPNICGQSTPPQPPGGGTSPTSGGGPTQPVCGNGKCETGENSQNCPKDCPQELDFPLTIKTGITNIRLRPGDKATYPFSMTNRLNTTVTADVSVSGLDKYFTLEKSSVDIGANKTETFNIYVTVPETIETGTYTGTITVSAAGKTKEVPMTMIIGLEGKSQLNLVLSLITKRVEPGGELKYTVEIRNVGFGANLTAGMVYTVRDAMSEEIIKQENETLNFTLSTGESYTFNKVMELKDTDIPVGQYYLEAVASFDHRFVRDIETFEVSQIFWASPIGQFVSWFIIIGALVAMAFYERRRYMRWKTKKSRYLFPVNYSKIPQESDEAFWIGRIAETEKKAWFNPNDLTTHVLIAGSTGAGKSVGASVFIEEALDKKVSVIVFDPTAQWTGFVKQCEDENLLKFYRQFGMDVRYTKPYKGMILEITDPHIIIDFKKYMNPGEITVFTMNKLGPGEYDVAVKNIINAIFKTGWEESTKLKMIMVFDEVHRLLEKYGGIGGYISLEQACREFRKWGIGIIMCSQVLADFKEAIAGNVLTDIQMNTKSLIDIRKVETKYGSEYATRISRQGVGVGMIQNPKYNDGKPYFVQFRPTWHNPHKITDEEMSFYKEFAQRLEFIERKIDEMRKAKKDVSDIEIELKLAKDKLKQGRFRMAKIYVNSLEEHLNIKQETPK